MGEPEQGDQPSGERAGHGRAPLGLLFLAAALGLALVLAIVALIAFAVMSRQPARIAPAAERAGASR